MKRSIKYGIIVGFLLFICIRCIEYIEPVEYCAYCREQKNGFVALPFCNTEKQFLKQFTDSIYIAGLRINQDWICEIR
jgi:hypothetical protein